MGWKIRIGHRYYYTSQREGGKVKTRYHGGGWIAEAIAKVDDAHRDEQAWEELRRLEDRARVEAADRLVAAFGRGEDVGAALVELMRRTEANPKAMISARWGDLARLVAGLLTEEQFKHRLAQKAAVRARHKQIREELSGPDPTPIEALLAERAALDRLRLHSHECWYSFGSEGSTLAGCEHLERVRDRLHRRYLASLRTLASVRRMNLSGATFIVGGVQQVNLPGGNRPPAPVQDRRTIDVAVGE